MSTISGVGGTSSAWADMMQARAAAMKDRLLAEADTDGNGSVDKAELQGALDSVARKTGNAAGMKSVLSPAASTMDFAQQRESDKAVDALFSSPAGEGSAKDGGKLSVAGFLAAATSGRPGVPAPDASSPGQINQTDLARSIASAMDVNGDGQISQAEGDDFRSQIDGAIYHAATSYNAGIAAGEPGDRSSALASAMDADGDHQISQSEADDFRSQVDGALYASATSYNAEASANLPPGRSRAIASAMDVNGDRQISQNEADDFRTRVDSTIYVAATSYNAGGLDGVPNDLTQALAQAMDVDGDNQISQNEADDFRTRIDGTIYAAATSYNAGAEFSGNHGAVVSSDPAAPPEPSALGQQAANEYSQAATNFAPTQTLDVAA